MQLERVITFVHNNKQLSKDFIQPTKRQQRRLQVVYSYFHSKVSTESWMNKMASTPNIALHQLEVRGTDYGDNDYHKWGEDRARFLGFRTQ